MFLRLALIAVFTLAAFKVQACGSCLVEEIAFDNPLGIIGTLDGGWDASEPTIVVDRVLRNTVEGLTLKPGDRLAFSLTWRKKLIRLAKLKKRKPNVETRTEGIWLLDYKDGEAYVKNYGQLMPLKENPQYVDAVLGKLDQNWPGLREIELRTLPRSQLPQKGFSKSNRLETNPKP